MVLAYVFASRQMCSIRQSVCAKNLLLSTQQNLDNKAQTTTTNISDSCSSYSNITKIKVSILALSNISILALNTYASTLIHFNLTTHSTVHTTRSKNAYGLRKGKANRQTTTTTAKHTHTQLFYTGPTSSLSLRFVAYNQSSLYGAQGRPA